MSFQRRLANEVLCSSSIVAVIGMRNKRRGVWLYAPTMQLMFGQVVREGDLTVMSRRFGYDMTEYATTIVGAGLRPARGSI